jgi:hypothetical protein
MDAAQPHEEVLPSQPIETQPSTSHHEVPQYSVKTLLAWTAPGRPYQKRSKQYFMSILLITILVEVIVFLFSEYLLMMVILSLAFVASALALVPPHPYHYRISSEGITIEDHYFLWQELYDFYFRTQHAQDVLVIRTKAFLPGELSLVLGGIHKEQVKSILLGFLPYREVIHQTFVEKSGNWLAQTFPLEKTSS